MPAGLPKEPYKSKLSNLKNVIYLKAAELFKKTAASAGKLVEENKIDDASLLLEKVISDFGIEEYAVKARTIRAEILNAHFEREEAAMLNVVDWATASNRNLALFIVTILCVPLVLLLV